MFLVGKNIPDYIRNLPETFLNTPFGQMMKPQIDMALRGVTQGGPQQRPGPSRPTARPARPAGKVRIVTSLSQLESELASASNSCAAIFFTSATCPPCKTVYPTYDELAEEAGPKAALIKVDISSAFDVSSKYGVRATPTFMTFLKGEKLDQWSGANPAQLRGNIRMLVQMAHPPHPHRKLNLPSFQRNITNYVLYRKAPPLEKLVRKLDTFSEDPRIVSMMDFIKATDASTPADTPLPDLSSFAIAIQSIYPSLPLGSKFALVDLVRFLFLDPRVSGYFAEETNQKTLLTFFPSADFHTSPYQLRIVLLQLSCNLFSSPLYPAHIASGQELRERLLSLATSSLFDRDHSPLRVTAASLVYNIAVFNHNARWEGNPDRLPEETQVELVAALIESISHEEEGEALRGMLSAMGMLVYEADMNGEVVELCKVMGAAGTIAGKSGDATEVRELMKHGL